MEKTLAIHLQELREEIAKDVEGYRLTWHASPGGIPLHSNCYNCNAEPRTRTYDSARVYFGKSIYQELAKHIRGTHK